ncbi:MAG: hypothetical protein M1823_005682 [Watsoniomyces obsoletus]|nr:MAG: hypothetical protein M1823_005682 [Watsoniomyces obsoletus]
MFPGSYPQQRQRRPPGFPHSGLGLGGPAPFISSGYVREDLDASFPTYGPSLPGYGLPPPGYGPPLQPRYGPSLGGYGSLSGYDGPPAALSRPYHPTEELLRREMLAQDDRLFELDPLPPRAHLPLRRGVDRAELPRRLVGAERPRVMLRPGTARFRHSSSEYDYDSEEDEDDEELYGGRLRPRTTSDRAHRLAQRQLEARNAQQEASQAKVDVEEAELMLHECRTIWNERIALARRDVREAERMYKIATDEKIHARDYESEDALRQARADKKRFDEEVRVAELYLDHTKERAKADINDLERRLRDAELRARLDRENHLSREDDADRRKRRDFPRRSLSRLGGLMGRGI